MRPTFPSVVAKPLPAEEEITSLNFPRASPLGAIVAKSSEPSIEAGVASFPFKTINLVPLAIKTMALTRFTVSAAE